MRLIPYINNYLKNNAKIQINFKKHIKSFKIRQKRPIQAAFVYVKRLFITPKLIYQTKNKISIQIFLYLNIILVTAILGNNV